jgi:hypothetical protein
MARRLIEPASRAKCSVPPQSGFGTAQRDGTTTQSVNLTITECFLKPANWNMVFNGQKHNSCLEMRHVRAAFDRKQDKNRGARRAV